jgi:pyruvate dehydrogenase E2 component (dihydrolipoamide acetyltransferase)
MTKVASLRAKAKDEFEKRYETKLTFMPFFIKAAVAGLRAFPTMNASLDGTNVILHKEINVGIAVALDWGLLVPVIKSADEKNILGIQRTMNDLAERARAKKLKPEEMTNGTFSISNLGMFGIDEFAAVINPPEGAILAVGQVRDVAVVQGGAVVPGKRVALTLSCDHRVVDGAVGAAFLAELRRLVERPLRVLAG